MTVPLCHSKLQQITAYKKTNYFTHFLTSFLKIKTFLNSHTYVCVCPFLMIFQIVSIKLHTSNIIGAHNHIFLLN